MFHYNDLRRGRKLLDDITKQICDYTVADIALSTPFSTLFIYCMHDVWVCRWSVVTFVVEMTELFIYVKALYMLK